MIETLAVVVLLGVMLYLDRESSHRDGDR